MLRKKRQVLRTRKPTGLDAVTLTRTARSRQPTSSIRRSAKGCVEAVFQLGNVVISKTFCDGSADGGRCRAERGQLACAAQLSREPFGMTYRDAASTPQAMPARLPDRDGTR